MIRPNFHAKTLLADDDLICEGSFNWLSAVTQIDHGANNFEMSVAVRGNIAHDMIQSFEKTAIGKFVGAKPRETTQVPLKKEPRVAPHKKQPPPQQTKEFRLRNEPHVNEQPPLKKPRVVPASVPPSFDNVVKTYSGKQLGREGYCVRFNGGDYLRKGKDILYFETPERAKQAAYAIWRK